MTATATIRDTTFREGARVAALIVVLMIAAVLGLVVGTALQGQSSTGVGAEAPGAAADTGTPSYADPHYQITRAAAGTVPAQTDPRAHIYAPVGGAAAVAPTQTDPRAHIYAPVGGAAAVAPAQTDPRAHLWAVVDSGEGKATLTAPTPD
ncbi:MAG TPA: hypothetical protein VEW95_09690 [Candidatus Limnocylindrales bacterium]|nr:hypothetical protein [Candidatus Limnocylindrales bacterium]